MIKEAMEYIAGLIDKANTNNPVEIHDTHYSKFVAWNGTMHEFKTDPPQYSHLVYDIPSLIKAVDRDPRATAGEPARAFVGMDSVSVFLNYKDVRPDIIKMNLSNTAAHAALLAMQNTKGGFRPKDFIALLDRHFRGTVDESLRNTLSGISLSVYKNASVKIDSMGLTSKENKRVVSLLVGDTPVVIPVDWTFVIPVMDCWFEPCTFPVRIAFDTTSDDELFVSVSLIDYQIIMNNHRARFIEMLDNRFDNKAIVFSGNY